MKEWWTDTGNGISLIHSWTESAEVLQIRKMWIDFEWASQCQMYFLNWDWLLKFQIWSCEVCKVFETDRRAGFNRRWGYGNVKDNYWTGKKYISTDTPLQVPFPSCIQQSGLKYIGGISLIMHHSQGRAPLRFKMNNEHGLGYWFGHQKCVVAACVYQPGTAMDCLVPN